MKKYYLYKRQRYGMENQIITPLGRMSFFAAISLLRFLPAVTVCSLLDVLYAIFKSNFFFYAFVTYSVLIFFYEIYFLFKTLRVSCCYCSKNRNEVETHRKSMCSIYPDYQSRITEIIVDNGWYMYFAK